MRQGEDVGRHERLLDPTAGTLQAFAEDLRELRRVAGGPSYRALARRAGYSPSALSAAASGTVFPSLSVTLAYAGACGGDVAAWERRWYDVEATMDTAADASASHAAQSGPSVPGVPSKPTTPSGPTTPSAPNRPGAPPHELPLDVYAFTGRNDELAELDRLLDTAREAAPAVVISAVSGTAGVGKTALAVRWAHRVADRFPDGCLYVDLRGYDPDQPMRPDEALAAFLRALGVNDGDIPAGPTERAALYRSLLAGRRLLVVLDNACSVDQVRPLLPGSASCFVLVTSRDSLVGLVVRDGARRIDLDLLPAGEAVALLRTLLNVRVDADPQAAAALADRCARLPLALRIAAELAAVRPSTPLADLVAELADEQRRLDLLDAGADERTAVRAVFSWSYRQLPPDAARLFRLLGLHPGPDLEAYAAAALADIDVDRCRHLLDELTRAHLVQETALGRFEMHDLLRAYAAGLGAAEPEPDRRAALTRLVHLYLAIAGSAMDAGFPHERHRRPRIAAAGTPTPPIEDAGQARAWLDAERANMVAVAGRAATAGLPTHVGHLAATVSRYLYVGAYYADAIALQGYALAAARTAGDRYGEGTALHHLGRVYWRLSRYDEAFDCQQQALEIAREVGDRAGEADRLNNIGSVYDVWGRVDEAVDYYERALAIRREVGDRAGEGRTLGNIGVSYGKTSRHARAIEYFTLALEIFRENGDRPSEARTVGNIGLLYSMLGRYEQARGQHEQALEIFRAVDDRAGVGNALAELGNVYGRLGRFDEALDCHRQALAIDRAIGYRAGTGETLADLGLLYLRWGRHDESAGCLSEALAIGRETHNRRLEVRALNGLGAALRALDQPEQALKHHDSALGIARDIGEREQQARALDGLAHARRASGEPDQAREHWREALTLFEALNLPDADDIRAHLTDRP
jgi:tetratricopeptide (TPR) repeat protein